LQIYLPSENGETRRVRKRIYEDKITCTETKKIRIDNMSSTEIEREVSLEEFSTLASKIKEGTSPIFKTRHTFIYEGQLFEIDVYPNWKNTAIMETELENREIKAEIPPFINIIADVTGDYRYSNSAMSQKFPKEII
jgi:CYTH domain-containing protein